MKKLYLLSAIMTVACICACDNELVDEMDAPEEDQSIKDSIPDFEWDANPIGVFAYMQDSLGNDMLNPNTTGAIDVTKVVARYKDKLYYVKNDSTVIQKNTIETRIYLAKFKGLTLEVNYYGKYYLDFGEFDGHATWESETVEIDWGNELGSSVFTFSSKFIGWDYENTLAIYDRTFKFDGMEYKSGRGEVTLQPGIDNKLHAVE